MLWSFIAAVLTSVPFVGAPACVTVYVPYHAQVWFDECPTYSVGTYRYFETPVLHADCRYVYNIHACWYKNGYQIIKAQKVYVWAGQHLVVDFR